MEAAFGIVGGKVEQFSMTFESDKYEPIKNALIEAHGPGQESSSIRKTLSGTTFESRKFSIVKSSGELTLLEHAGRIDRGAIDGRTPIYSAYIERIKRGDSKAGGKDI